jgi:N-acetylglutamate synthase
VSGPAPVRRPDTARRRGAGEEASAPTAAELLLIERQLARLPELAGAQVADVADLGGLLVTLPGRGPGYNFAACVRWTAADVPARLTALRRRFGAAGEWPTLIVAEGLTEPAGLAERLAAEGWVELERERIYFARSQPTVPHLSPALRIEAVTARTAAECEQIEQRVFGLAERHADSRARNLARAIDAGALRAYLVRLDGVAVASARLSIENGLAAISGVGVLPEHRRAGLATLVTAIVTRAGLALGSSLVWLSVDERNAPALKVYRRLGYQPTFGWSRWAASAR